MEDGDRVRAGEVAAGLLRFRDELRGHRDLLNRLNVFPVPDGDTGTNLLLTMESVAAVLEPVAPADLGALSEAVGRASLMGARGNSGVILSQLLRGMLQTLAGSEGSEVASALATAATTARAAVQRPVEGTVLTVADAAAAGARSVAVPSSAATELAGEPGSTAAAGESPPREDAPPGRAAVLRSASDAALAALAQTPSMLPALEAAGVVDAGGAGYVLLLESLAVAAGSPARELGLAGLAVAGSALGHAAAGAGAAGAGVQPIGAGGGTGAGEGSGVGSRTDRATVAECRFEVMYLLEAPDSSIAAFRDVWAGIGDSIVVVGGDGLWSCHIHTDDIGPAIEAGLDVGRPRQIRVTDLAEQVEEERWVREAGTHEGPEGVLDGPVHPTAVVTVAPGAGVRRIFRSLGVREVVEGGSGQNPSVAELLAAIGRAGGEAVVVLPNEGNVVPVAMEAAKLADKPVAVVPTRSVPAGIAAACAYDPESDLATNAGAMGEAADRVVATAVTRAVRPSNGPTGPIAVGDWLGLAGDRIEVVEQSAAMAVVGLLVKLVRPDHELLTLIEGEGASEADVRAVEQWVGEHHPDLAVEAHHGNQPVYAFLLGLE